MRNIVRIWQISLFGVLVIAAQALAATDAYAQSPDGADKGADLETASVCGARLAW